MSDVKIVVSAETSAVNSGLKAASNAVQGFKNTASSAFLGLRGAIAGFFAVEALKGSTTAILDEFGRIQDLADKFGESAESMQKVGYAAKLSGSDVEAVSAAMQKVNGNALDAVRGNQALKDAFASLGLDAGSFIDLPMEEKLQLLAKGFEEGGSNAEKMDSLIAVLGKSGADLIPLLSGGAEGLKSLFAEAGVAGNESVAKLAEAGDKIDRTFNNIKAAGAMALAFLITQVETLWHNLNSVGVYLANLPDGFEAASQAVADFRSEYAEKQKAEEEKPKKKTNLEALEAKGRADEVKKAEEAARREKLRQELTDAKKTQGEWEKEFQKRQDRKNEGIAVDSLRRVGGNLNSSEAANIQSQNQNQLRQIDFARQQLETAKRQVELLEKLANPTLTDITAGFEA